MNFLRWQAVFLVKIVIDILIVAFSFYLAHLIRFDFAMDQRQYAMFLQALPVVLIAKPVIFYAFGLYHAIWQYISTKELENIVKGSTIASLVIISCLLILYRFEGFSRSVFIIDWLATIFLVAGVRVMFRFYYADKGSEKTVAVRLREMLVPMLKKAPDRKRLLIIGAGDAAEKVFREIQNNRSLNYQIVGMLDDHPSKRGKRIHGVPVLGTIDETKAVATAVKADEALIAIPSATGEQMRRIIGQCKLAGLKSKTIPGLSELIDGSISIRSIRDVEFRDILGREIIRMETDKIGAYLRNQCVLVTGAGGSIGSELCRQICRYAPKKLVLFEQTENALYNIDLELRDAFKDIEIIPLLANIQDKVQIRHILSRYMPQTIFHAAAYKQVPLLEHQPWKAVANNIRGTMNMAECAQSQDVERFVFVSTDKAVCPRNVMGASKRVAEMVVQAQHSKTRFMIVRFGNVVGSAGSVVPLFKKQIEMGGPVTVTHPDITRYFMLIPEACQLILQAGGMGNGGEIFLLDMGQPVKISDMARDLIRLSGFEPDTDIKIKYIGIRPGEKLHEELFCKDDETIVPTYHEKIMLVKNRGPVDPTILFERIETLLDLAAGQEGGAIIEGLKELVPGYATDSRTGVN